MIKSYWLRILLCGVAAAILGFVIGLVTPKQYDAVVQVLLAPYSPVMASQSPDPADNSVQDILNASAPRTVATQVDMLTSIGVLQNAAEKVAGMQNPPVDIKDPDSELNWAQLQDKIMITAAKESDVVMLRVRMSKPDLAQQVAQQIYVSFEDLNEHQSRAAADNAITFLTSQNDAFQGQMRAVEDAAAKARLENGVMDVQVQTQAIVAEIRDLDTTLETAKSDLEAAKARYETNRAKVANIPKQTAGGSSVSENPQWSRLQANLNDALAAKAGHLQRYLPDSDQVQQDDMVIKNLRAQIKDTARYVPNLQSSKQPNPTWGQMDQEVTLSQAAIAAASQKVAALENSVAQKKAELGRLPEVEKKLNGFDRRRLVYERIAQLYQSKLKTLEMAKMARTARTAPVTTAVAYPRASIPNMQLNVGLGLFLGLAIGFLWSLGTEAKRNPIRSLGQLNRLSLLPCYRVIPELRVPMRGLGRPPAEVFDALLANFVRSEKKGYRLGVLGVSRAAGATNSAMNMAIAAARGGYNVLYVPVDTSSNVASKLTGDAGSLAASITVFGGENLGSGLDSAAVGKDLVIYDFPPVKTSGDAFLTANQLDEMVLLVRQNQTKSVDFLQAQQALIDAGCPLVSVVLSRVQDQSDDVSALEQQADSRSITPQA